MPSPPANRRLALALGVSLLLHATLLGEEFLHGKPPVPVTRHATPTLQARLSMPAELEPLLKNTLAVQENPPAPPVSKLPSTSPAKPTPTTRTHRSQERAAQRKLSEHLYYPPAAIALGLEGETRLLLTLAADGTILDIRIASSSTHAILDQAAVNAARSMQRIPDSGMKELLLPVIFRLQ